MKAKPPSRRKPLWGAAFETAPGEALTRLSVSHPFDRRLASQDIAGTAAHARSLHRAGLLSRRDLTRLEKALGRIEREIAAGTFRFEDADEDIHLNVERRLIELTGRAGRRIHAGRSRNEQIALDLRLWTAAAVDRVSRGLRRLALGLLDRAEEFRSKSVIVAARTHMRSAQPVLLSHVFHAYAEMLRRDVERLGEARRRTAVSPLGSGACAGTTLRLDRKAAARELGLPDLTPNSLDAVSDRDFVLDFVFAASVVMLHLSRLSEDLILWTGEEFRLFRLPENTTTGSSMMPQKRNPDALELVRAKAGRVAGHLMATLVAMKGLPLSYNRDLQETQEPLFGAADTLEASLAAMVEVIGGLDLRPEAERSPVDSSTLATDIAEELVRRGHPFRTAHERVARWSRAAARSGADLREIAAKRDPGLRAFLKGLSLTSSVARRDLPGGTAPRRVKAAIRRTRKALQTAAGPPPAWRRRRGRRRVPSPR